MCKKKDTEVTPVAEFKPEDQTATKFEMNEKKLSGLTKFFGGAFNRFVMKAKWVIILVLLPIGIAGFFKGMQIKPITEQEEYLPDEHPILAIMKVLENDFTVTENSVDNLMVNIHWGIDDLDRSSVRSWEVTDLGELIFDDYFDVSPPEN
jgi:hypothetical protein